MSDATSTRYAVTARPFYKMGDRVWYSDEEGDDVRLGDVLLDGGDFVVDADGDLTGRVERTGRDATVNVRGCLTLEAALAASDPETVSVKHIAEVLLDFGVDGVRTEAIIAVALRRQARG